MVVWDRTCLWKDLLAGKLASLEPALTMHTAVPPQRDCLAISYNNIQLIYLICSFLGNHCKTSPDRKLVITSNKEIPVQLCGSTITQEPYLTSLNEEADVIIVQQAILLARSGSKYNQIIADGTDVFVLHIFFIIISVSWSPTWLCPERVKVEKSLIYVELPRGVFQLMMNSFQHMESQPAILSQISSW